MTIPLSFLWLIGCLQIVINAYMRMFPTEPWTGWQFGTLHGQLSSTFSNLKS